MRSCFRLISLLVSSVFAACAGTDTDVEIPGPGVEAVADCELKVEAVIKEGVKVSGVEGPDGAVLLHWNVGDVLSSCWKDDSGKWHRVSFVADQVMDGRGAFLYKSGDRPYKDGTVVYTVSLGTSVELPFDGEGECDIDLSDQSDHPSPVLLFGSSVLESNTLFFSLEPKSAVLRFVALKGLPDLDFQGVIDYFPEVTLSGSHLETRGSISLSPDGSLQLRTSGEKNQKIVLSRSKYGSGVNSNRSLPFGGGLEENLLVGVLPYTSDKAACSNLSVSASAVYGSYSLSLEPTSFPIVAGEAVLIDTVSLLPPPLVSQYDENRAVGFGGCRKDSDKIVSDYVLDGGRRGRKTVVLTATGDDGQRIKDAVGKNSIVILDGSKGDFIINKGVTIENKTGSSTKLSNRTIVGVNGAFLRTSFHLTEEIVDKLKNSGLSGLSQSSGTGGSIYDPADKSGFYDRWKGKNIKSDGTEYNVKIDNAMELMSRRAMIDILEDPLESYREKAGIWNVAGAENVIIRNIRFRGPGAVDVSANDVMYLCAKSGSQSNHVWIDHCDLSDGMDGNLDIFGHCDFLSISWSHQHYGPLPNYGHKYSCLIGGADIDTYRGKNHITFNYCRWGEGIQARTPMMRYGVVHMLNCYFAYRGGTYMIDPCKEASIFIDCCHFVQSTGGWVSKRYTNATAVVYNNSVNVPQTDLDKTKGSVDIPYSFFRAEPSALNYIVDSGVGPTLTNPLDYGY